MFIRHSEKQSAHEPAPNAQPLVYVVVVNWNTAEYTVACFASLQAISYPNYRILVIDNASSDGSPDVIGTAYPDVSLIRLSENFGFTGANNVGFQHALEHGAAFVYLLNADTRVAPNFLTQAVHTALSDASIGIVGSKVLHADRPDTLQSMGLRANLTIGHHGRSFGYDQIDQGQCDHITDVDLLGGCAMMISRACLETVGGFDDAFFAFQEDFDVCLQAKAAGFRVVMSPLSRVWHYGGGSVGGAVSASHMYYNVRNTLRLLGKHRPMSNKAVKLVRTGCVVGAHVMQVLLNKPSRAALREIVRGALGYHRGIAHARPQP